MHRVFANNLDFGKLLVVTGTFVFVMMTGFGCAPVSNASSDSFNSKDTVISGTTKGRGVTCFRFKIDNGEEISIIGNKSSLRAPNLSAKIQGKWQETSNCQQGRTFFIEKILSMKNN